MTRAFDFDKPRRQGRGAWVLMFLKLLRTLIKHLFPVLVVTIFRKMSWSRTLLVLAIFVGALLLIAFVLSLIRYRKLRFCVREGFLLISDHIWGRRETSIPLEKIHNIRTRSGFFYQLVEMESLQFDTLGESKAEVELLLSMEESAALRALIASATATGETTAMPTATTSDSGMASEAQSTEATQDFHYSMGQLLAGAFTQNPLRVFLVIGSVIALLYQNLDNYLIKYHEAILHKTETFVSGTSVLTLATLLFGAYLICLLLYGGKIVLQQYGLTVRLDERGLAYRAGLLTVVRQQIRHDRILFLTIKQNPIERRLGLSSVQFEQARQVAGNEKKRDASITLYGWRETDILLRWWSGDSPASLSRECDVRSLPALARRNILVSVLPVCGALMLIGYLWSPYFYAFAAVWAIIGTMQSVLIYKHSGVCMDKDYLVVHGGAFARKRSVLPLVQMEQVELSAGFFQRRRGTANLRFSTKGQALEIKYLPRNAAGTIRNVILHEIEKNRTADQ